MKTQTNYQQAREYLKKISIYAKIKHGTDKPMVCQIINDECYFIERENNLTNYQKQLIQNYASKLQPK